MATLGLGAWLVSLIALLAGRGLAGLTRIGLYPLYGSALVLGWGLGNLYVARTRGEIKALKRLLLPVYLLTPPGILFLMWATASMTLQVGIPLAPVYACGIFGILFLVPVTFARSGH